MMNTPAVTLITEPSTTLDQDALLQASRRVDWRFLLPDPELGDAAYIGHGDPSLIDSLQQFTCSLTMLGAKRSDIADTSRYPLVVANNPTLSELRQAAEVTRAGGFVYIEVDKRLSPQSSNRNDQDGGRPRAVSACLSAMRKLDLCEPQVYWHWPSFESCNEIVPLLDRSAGVCALRRRGSSLRARWKRRLARSLLETRLLARFVPCFSVIARRS